jgi:hypothetical protein
MDASSLPFDAWFCQRRLRGSVAAQVSLDALNTLAGWRILVGIAGRFPSGSTPVRWRFDPGSLAVRIGFRIL